ncbi:hypothetical protein [Actinopolyspora lacussalsi]|uniref:hypothetical protein n=1 Tax=Actinopolyspora righensis TaxID=995060 RepID=UPI001113A21A|nr:hypothetical protein [Actinopolyspora righensis]
MATPLPVRDFRRPGRFRFFAAVEIASSTSPNSSVMTAAVFDFLRFAIDIHSIVWGADSLIGSV